MHTKLSRSRMRPSTTIGLKSIFVIFLIFYYSCYVVEARKHHLEVRDDMRPYIALSTFGFYTNGHLDVELSKLRIDDEESTDVFGLSLDKTTIDQMNPYLDSHQNKCILEEDPTRMVQTGPILFFKLDLKELKVRVQCSTEWKNMRIYKDRSYRRKRQSQGKVSDSALFVQRRRRRDTALEDDHDLASDAMNEDDSIEQPKEQPLEKDIKLSSPISNIAVTASAAAAPAAVKSSTQTAVVSPVVSGEANSAAAKLLVAPAVPAAPAAPVEPVAPPISKLPVEEEPVAASKINTQLCKDFSLPLTKQVIDNVNYYNMTFSMFVATLHDEGLYNLYFHACPNYKGTKMVSFNVEIVEENNNGNFLSAGEMPLPALYFMMSLLFFLSGLFWVFILKKSKHPVYKIHYLMAVLVFLKSLSLMFHSINYHFIQKCGEHVETWAILYYIAHLLKGAVLFITIVLIGTGWTFIKHILSDKDKKIFMIVIPLQILANVAQIITDESDLSDAEFRTWHSIFFFVDLLCCGAILFPIVWSIRHLHEASATDGKAAINLRKLKLFRQFYIMIVCYIYFTRIIVDLLQMTVVFQYAWLDEMFREMATYVFFVLTGYKFRPTSSHPYFTVPDDDDDEVEVLTQSGLTEGVHRTKPLNRNAHQPTTIIEGNDEEREILIAKRESSHEYD